METRNSYVLVFEYKTKSYINDDISNMSNQIIVIDSSDDEESTEKKIKLDTITSETSKNDVDKLIITNVTSLLNQNDVVVIEDDDKDDILNVKLETQNNEPQTKNSEIQTKNNEPETKTNTQNNVRENYNSYLCEKSGSFLIDDTTSVTTSKENEEKTKKTIIPLPCTKVDSIIKTNNECNLDDLPSDKPNTENTSSEMIPEFKEFLEVCTTYNSNEKYTAVIQNKIKTINDKYFKTDPQYLKSKGFLRLLRTKIELVKVKPAHTIVYFNDVYQEMKARRKLDTPKELTERQLEHLKRLGKTLKAIYKVINKLENAEVDWDDDSDSAYIQLDRYRQRFVLIYEKICEYTGENKYVGRPLYQKLDFASSKYSEINRAIDAWYNRHKTFPTYMDMQKCVRKCARDKELGLSDYEIEMEAKKMFTALGNLIQRRRKHELQDVLIDFLGVTKDPALEDTSLKNTLDMQYKMGMKRIDAVFEEYSERQKKGEEPVLSTDSEDSHRENWSDSEED